jgi:Tfp pilus assembly protein PilO
MKRPHLAWRWWRIDLIGAAVCAAMTLAVCLGGIVPLAGSHEEVLKMQAETVAQQSQAARLDATLTATREKLRQAQKKLDESPLRLETSTNVFRRLSDVSALASDSGLSLDDIRPGPAAVGTYCDTVPIAMAGNGTYRACAAFLARLCRVMPDTGVSSLEVAAVGVDPSGSGKFHFDLEWHVAPRSAGTAK